MDNDTKDLISNLLKLNPLERLGVGEIGSKPDRSFNGLKNHKFFKGINMK